MTGFRNFVRSSWIGRVLLIPWRFKNAMTVVLNSFAHAVRWTFQSREHYNYSYDLEPLNLDYLASFISVITGENFAKVRGYIAEIENDNHLKDHVVRLNAAAKERYVADREARFGRRMGWYALVRATRPKIVVETGVDKGLGSVVIAAALMRNSAEGHSGELIGLDINPNAGYLLTAPYSKVGRIVYGDSLASIAAMSQPIDFFIHDSDHSAEHEEKELKCIQSKLGPTALVVSDNATATSELLKFARETGRHFLFFAEKPKDHWWPGEGIGVAFNRT
jgi:predicted O-methyltransferase YrrM